MPRKTMFCNAGSGGLFIDGFCGRLIYLVEHPAFLGISQRAFVCDVELGVIGRAHEYPDAIPYKRRFVDFGLGSIVHDGNLTAGRSQYPSERFFMIDDRSAILSVTEFDRWIINSATTEALERRRTLFPSFIVFAEVPRSPVEGLHPIPFAEALFKTHPTQFYTVDAMQMRVARRRQTDAAPMSLVVFRGLVGQPRFLSPLNRVRPYDSTIDFDPNSGSYQGIEFEDIDQLVEPYESGQTFMLNEEYLLEVLQRPVADRAGSIDYELLSGSIPYRMRSSGTTGFLRDTTMAVHIDTALDRVALSQLEIKRDRAKPAPRLPRLCIVVDLDFPSVDLHKFCPGIIRSLKIHDRFDPALQRVEFILYYRMRASTTQVQNTNNYVQVWRGVSMSHVNYNSFVTRDVEELSESPSVASVFLCGGDGLLLELSGDINEKIIPCSMQRTRSQPLRFPTCFIVDPVGGTLSTYSAAGQHPTSLQVVKLPPALTHNTLVSNFPPSCVTPKINYCPPELGFAITHSLRGHLSILVALLSVQRQHVRVLVAVSELRTRFLDLQRVITEMQGNRFLPASCVGQFNGLLEMLLNERYLARVGGDWCCFMSNMEPPAYVSAQIMDTLTDQPYELPPLQLSIHRTEDFRIYVELLCRSVEEEKIRCQSSVSVPARTVRSRWHANCEAAGVFPTVPMWLAARRECQDKKMLFFFRGKTNEYGSPKTRVVLWSDLVRCVEFIRLARERDQNVEPLVASSLLESEDIEEKYVSPDLPRLDRSKFRSSVQHLPRELQFGGCADSLAANYLLVLHALQRLRRSVIVDRTVCDYIASCTLYHDHKNPWSELHQMQKLLVEHELIRVSAAEIAFGSDAMHGQLKFETLPRVHRNDFFTESPLELSHPTVVIDHVIGVALECVMHAQRLWRTLHVPWLQVDEALVNMDLATAPMSADVLHQCFSYGLLAMFVPGPDGSLVKVAHAIDVHKIFVCFESDHWVLEGEKANGEAPPPYSAAVAVATVPSEASERRPRLPNRLKVVGRVSTEEPPRGINLLNELYLTLEEFDAAQDESLPSTRGSTPSNVPNPGHDKSVEDLATKFASTFAWLFAENHPPENDKKRRHCLSSLAKLFETAGTEEAELEDDEGIVVPPRVRPPIGEVREQALREFHSSLSRQRGAEVEPWESVNYFFTKEEAIAQLRSSF